MARRHGIGYDFCCQVAVTLAGCIHDAGQHHYCAVSVTIHNTWSSASIEDL